MKVKSESEVAQSFLTLSNPMDCSLPGSFVHGFSRQEYWSGVPLPSPYITITCPKENLSPQAVSVFLDPKEQSSDLYYRVYSQISGIKDNSLMVQGLGVLNFTAGLQGTWLWSLVGELRSHRPHGMAKRKRQGRKERGQENHHIHTCFNLGNLQTYRLQDWLLRKGEGMIKWYVAVIKLVPLRLGYLTLN